MERTSSKKILTIATVGVMAALVFVGNYFQIQIPNGILVTRIHLGNSMCLLAGLLFCSSTGGISSGIGAALFDLMTPAYVISAPFTFISKFAMGFVAGKLNMRGNDGKIKLVTTILAAIAGQITYIILYLSKTFFTVLIIGGAVEAAWAAVATNLLTSTINAVAAVVIAVPLYLALRKALVKTPFKDLINPRSEKKGYFNPVTIGLTIFAFATAAIYAMNLAATTKIEKAQQEKQAELQAKLDDYEAKFDYISEQLGIEFPETIEVKTAE